MTKTRTWPYMRWVGGAGALLALSACATLPSIPGDLGTLPIRARAPKAALAVAPANPYAADPYGAYPDAYPSAPRATGQLHVTIAAAAQPYRTLALGPEVARVVVALTHLRTGTVESRTLRAADLARPMVVADFDAMEPGPVFVHAVSIATDERTLAEGSAEAVLVASRSAGLTVTLGAPAPAARAEPAGASLVRVRTAAKAPRAVAPAGCRDFMALDADRSGAVDLDEFRMASARTPAPVACAPVPAEDPWAIGDEEAYDEVSNGSYDEPAVGPTSYGAGGLIDNNHGGLISSIAGGLISNNPGGLISNNPGSLIASNAGCLVSSSAGCTIAGDAPDPAVEGFRALDADVDGLLSPEELCGWEAPATPRAAR